MLSEPNVKVVFHQTAVHVTPLSAWIIYPKGSALGHSTRCLAEAWSSSVDSLFSFVVDAEPAAQWAVAAATWTPSFMLLPALSRAEPEFLIIPKEGCYPLGLLRFQTNRHLDLPKRFPDPAASPSLRRAA